MKIVGRKGDNMKYLWIAIKGLFRFLNLIGLFVVSVIGGMIFLGYMLIKGDIKIGQ